MKFGPVAVAEAVGAILAHSIRLPTASVRKGQRVAAADAAGLAAAGIGEVVVARLDDDDLHEDAAALRVAEAVAGAAIRVEPPFTGRCNLYAEAAGILLVDRAAVDRLNAVDPGVTLATLPEFAAVEAGRMVATLKIIPFAVPQAVAGRAAAEAAGAISLAPYRIGRVGVVSTLLPGLKSSLVEKTHAVLADRLAPAGAALVAVDRVEHTAAAVAEALRRQRAAGAELLVVFGASAVVDRHDVVPAGIEAAGGAVDHFGMPVDPGNLLLVGRLGGVPVIGAPGCARSPRENGFDWVLGRLLAGLAVGRDEITRLGVGGLLMEIVSRPKPREEAAAPADRPRVAAVVLAAGEGRRMGGSVKQLGAIAGEALVRRAARAALASRARPVVVVTGHEAAAVEAAVAGLNVAIVRNPRFRDGLATSLAAGLAALPASVDGAVVMLADMPDIGGGEVDRLIDAFNPAAGALIVAATAEGRRRNPVLWSRRYFDELARLTGDTGGRAILGRDPAAVVEVELGAAAERDLDTPEDLAAAGGLPGPRSAG